MEFIEAAIQFWKDPLLSIPNVADLCKVHPNTVHNWIKTGLPTERLNGTGNQYVRLSELSKYKAPEPTPRKACEKCGGSCCHKCGMAACEGC